jgi:uncharacterized cupin superfamily protein
VPFRLDLLLEQPIEPAWIVEGKPIARGVTLTTSPDGRLSTGLWECTAGRFHWHYWVDEIVYILDGAVTLSDRHSGEVLSLHPGDAALLPFGSTALWHVESFVRKFFVVRASPGRQRFARWSHIWTR